MATLAPGGRIQSATVDVEIQRLRSSWGNVGADNDNALAGMLGDRVSEIDAFDRAQLQYVIGVCRESSSLAEAGRQLFDVSRLAKAKPNDSDRLRKFLARFGLDFKQVQDG
jgi:transcriptional regulatory protein RtcR